MKVGELCTREVVICTRETSVVEVARRMRANHVGTLVVVQATGDRNVPVGIVTDRDLVVEVMAKEVDPAKLLVGDLVAGELVTAREGDAACETIERMRYHGVRRLPVVDDQGGLAGIVTVDDLAEYLGEELTELARVGLRQAARERRVRP